IRRLVERVPHATEKGWFEPADLHRDEPIRTGLDWDRDGFPCPRGDSAQGLSRPARSIGPGQDLPAFRRRDLVVPAEGLEHRERRFEPAAPAIDGGREECGVD